MKKLIIVVIFLAAGSVLQARAQGFLRSYEQYLKRHGNRATKPERAAEI